MALLLRMMILLRGSIPIAMKFQPYQLYHLYNQGNSRQQIFYSDRDYALFSHYIKEIVLPYAELLAYCLMPNHFHFLAYTTEKSVLVVKQGGLIIDALTNSIRKLLSGYARIFNSNNNRTGSLFRQKTKAKLITEGIRNADRKYTIEEYCGNCFNYIHNNPVAAGLVSYPSNWKWSSYNIYAGTQRNDYCNFELATKFCRYDPTTFGRQLVIDEYWNNLLGAEE